MMAERLGFALRADFLSDKMGFSPKATEGNAKLYDEADWPAICDALMDHVWSVRDTNWARHGTV